MSGPPDSTGTVISNYAALDASQDPTAICIVVNETRRIAERKIVTCPDAIASWPKKNAPDPVRIGMETGSSAVSSWNELRDKGLPIVCMDARRADAALFAICVLTYNLWLDFGGVALGKGWERAQVLTVRWRILGLTSRSNKCYT